MDIIETNLFGRETRLSYHYFIASIPVAEPLMPAFTWHLIVNELINNFKEKSSNVFFWTKTNTPRGVVRVSC